MNRYAAVGRQRYGVAMGGLVTFREGRVVFHDLAGLRTLAEYHSGYLDQSNGLGL